MRLGRKFLGLAAVAGAVFLSAASAHAVADLRLTQQAESGTVDLAVFDPSGRMVRAIALGAIREKISAGGQDFLASFGQNPSGNIVLIAAPDPDNPREVILRVNGRRIVISREAVVTIIFPLDPATQQLGEPLIRPGLVGTVTLDGRRLTPDVLVGLGTGQPIPIAQTTGPAGPPLNLDGPGGNDVPPDLTLSGFLPGGSSGFPGLDGNPPLPGGGGLGSLSQVPSSVSGFLGKIGINLNPSAATPIVPEQT